MTDAGQPSWIVRIPTPIWLLGLIAAALLIDWQLQLPAIARHPPAGFALLAAGFALSVWALQTFKAHSAEIMPSSQTHRAIVTTGPFRYTRNPMYLGALIVGVGAALIAGTWPMWLVPVLLFVLQNFAIIPFEERSMQTTFGDDFSAYRQRVRRWI